MRDFQSIIFYILFLKQVIILFFSHLGNNIIEFGKNDGF